MDDDEEEEDEDDLLYVDLDNLTDQAWAELERNAFHRGYPYDVGDQIDRVFAEPEGNAIHQDPYDIDAQIDQGFEWLARHASDCNQHAPIRQATTVSTARRGHDQSTNPNQQAETPAAARKPFQQQGNDPSPQEDYQRHQPRQPYLQASESGICEDVDVPTPAEEKEAYLPQNAPGDTTQREQWRQQRYAGVDRSARQTAVAQQSVHPQVRQDHKSVNYNLNIDAGGATAMDVVDEPQVASHRQRKSEREEALEAQLARLMRERDDLTRELDSTKTTVTTQRGEIAIVRSNQAKDTKGFDRQLIALKKSIQEEAAKHQIALEATNKRSEKIANENQFLKHELKEESEKIKALQKSLKSKEARLHDGDAAGTVTTPQKIRQLPLRDGFDDEDIPMVSPVKSGRKSKAGTPTTAAKRKRKVPDASPIPALTFRETSNRPPKEPEASKIVPVEQATKTIVIRKDPRVQKSLQFMQRMLNHRLTVGEGRILEVFSRYTFPSNTERTFTAVVLDGSATLSGETLPSGFMKIMISLWAQALQEKYYQPVPALVEVVQYIIARDSSVINSEVVQRIVPVLQSSIDVNAAVRFRHSPVSHLSLGQLKQTPKSEINTKVNGTAALDMLYTIACFCACKPKLLEDFWRTVDSNFVLMMLNVAQPISDLTLMLGLLSTSILRTTFGTILSNPSDQQKIEGYLLDRVAYLLWEIPRVDEGLPQPSRHDIYPLRAEAVSLLCDLALPPQHPHTDPNHHGSLLLVTHPSIIGRLVRFIYDTIDALYAPIEPTSPSHVLLSSLINRATHLLYRLLQLHGKNINLHEKLTAVNGGVQKHRVALTRLAFSEGMYLESGISDETVAMAHEMLEEAVTPEEAEALVQVFPAFKGRVVGGEAEEEAEGEDGDEE